MTTVSPNVRHLLKALGVEEYSITACGQRHPAVFTVDPDQVTCRRCQDTRFMVDAVFRKDQETRKGATE